MKNTTTVKETRNVGMGFSTILTLIFITLKLTGFINWSWLLVLSPMLISCVFTVLLVILYVILSK